MMNRIDSHLSARDGGFCCASGGSVTANPEKLHADTYLNHQSSCASVAEQTAAEAEALDAWFIALLVWFGPVMEALLGFPTPANPSASSTNGSWCWSSGSRCF
ncbi:MAG: hypothetical protein M1600_01595 [Firmicutes bacterium]|nr:hypothetical protein [Bacillota bacterium]